MKNNKGKPIYCRNDFGELIGSQERCAAMIVGGRTPSEVAAELGLPPMTVNRWTADPRFRAEVNRRRSEAWTGTLDTLRALAGKALKVVAAALDDDKADPDTRLKAAVVFLKSVKMNELAPSGPTDIVEVVLADAKREYRRAGEIAGGPFDSLELESNPLGTLGEFVCRKLEELPSISTDGAERPGA